MKNDAPAFGRLGRTNGVVKMETKMTTIERKFPDYDGDVIVVVTSEIGETRIALLQDGRWVGFSGEVLDQIAKARVDFENMTSREQRVFAAGQQ